MTTTYVFLIGGTGARVLRSLTMLLASGAKIKDGGRIVPIIIDYDLQNGDLQKAKDLLSAYDALNHYGAYTENEEGFFSTPIDLRAYSIADIHNDSSRDTFKKYIDLDTLKRDDVAPETALLMEALYDDSPAGNPRTELNLQMALGFKGNPNIGSVVFNEYFSNRSYGYSEFRSNFHEGDRIFIVGSIFGGTGSSGLPSLVKKFRQQGNYSAAGNSTALQNAPIGACVVLPYFNVEDNPESAIDSQAFNSKAKAALTYYDAEINKQINELYYIGCAEKNGSYKNVEGGKDQRNNAHLIELLSAMSIVEFASRNESEMQNRDMNGDLIPNCYEFYSASGLVEKDGRTQLPDRNYLDLLSVPNDLSDSLYERYVAKLTAFAYFAAYCREYTFTGKDGKFPAESYYKDRGDYIRSETDFGGKLAAFCRSFIEWADELASNPLLSFYPFDFSADLDHLVNLSSTKPVVKKVKNSMRIALKQGNDSFKGNARPESVFLHIGYEAGMAAVKSI